MECNKEEAKRAMNMAESKLLENDYLGANKFINKAQNLYPNLDGLNQVLMMINVFISSASIIGGESDWYGILGVDPLADDKTMKKQYKKLAFTLHPDKNKFKGAEKAVKLVNIARDLLTDKLKRRAYDQKRKWNEWNQRKTGMQQKPVPKPHESQKPYEPQKPHEPASSSTSSASNDRKKAAKEAQKEAQESWNRDFEESRQNAASSTTTSASNDSEKAVKEALERWTRLFQESRGNVDTAFSREKAKEEERLFKKPTTTTTTTNSTSEAERLFKKPMSSGDHANSSFEAERLFKKPMSSGHTNPTFGAQRIFRKQTHV